VNDQLERRIRRLNRQRDTDPQYAEARAQEERSNVIQLLILIAVVAGLALWAYVNR
jgi:hypothetical protein